MAQLHKFRFLLFVSLMIFPAHALDVIFSSALENFKQRSKINTYIEDGEKKYCGTLDPLTYQPDLDTTKVIVHIIDRSRFVEINRNAVRGIILQIAQELKEWHCELVFLGIDNFDDDEYHLISAFMLEKIQPQNEDQPNFIIETIGENHFDRVYPCFVMNIGRYRENVQICEGNLRARLRAIPRGALRPVDRNDKEIRLYGYHPTMQEVIWPVNVINGTYSPRVNVSDAKYNFRLRYKKKEICLLILDGKEYSTITVRGGRTTLKAEMAKILKFMTRNNEGLFIMGVFNFDWTEIDIVTQIILKHSIGWPGFAYNVFTYGCGMFNSNYLNVFEADGRDILPQEKSNITELIKVLMRGEVKDRTINMYYAEDGEWDIQKMPIRLENGRYAAEEKFRNYTFPWVNQKIVFIVHDPIEKSAAIDFRIVYLTVEELKQSGICVVLIEAINFGLGDTHIIAEWIDYHRGVRIQNPDTNVIDSALIVVLGAGIFDTIFQSELTTYSTLPDTRKNDLTNIRNAFVHSGNGKRILAAKIDKSSGSKFEVWTYPMNTVNGFYEPDLIPDKNMFDSLEGKEIFFIITSANLFQRISSISVEHMEPIRWLGRRMDKHFPHPNWSLYLAGLDNIGERDYHFFAELVKRQTDDERYLGDFVWIFNYGIGCAVYQYKDTPKLSTEGRSWVQSYIDFFFEMTCTQSRNKAVEIFRSF